MGEKIHCGVETRCLGSSSPNCSPPLPLFLCHFLLFFFFYYFYIYFCFFLPADCLSSNPSNSTSYVQTPNRYYSHSILLRRSSHDGIHRSRYPPRCVSVEDYHALLFYFFPNNIWVVNGRQWGDTCVSKYEAHCLAPRNRIETKTSYMEIRSIVIVPG